MSRERKQSGRRTRDARLLLWLKPGQPVNAKKLPGGGNESSCHTELARGPMWPPAASGRLIWERSSLLHARITGAVVRRQTIFELECRGHLQL